MCIPVAALPAIAMAGSAIGAAGTMVSGMQANSHAKYQAGIHRQNAVLEAEAARDSIDRGRIERRALWRDVGQVKGRQAAMMAASGVDLSFGTPLNVQQDTAMLAAEDSAMLDRNVGQRTRGFDINWSNSRAQAAGARQSGKSALIGSAFNAGSSLMSGFIQMRAMQEKLGIANGP